MTRPIPAPEPMRLSHWQGEAARYACWRLMRDWHARDESRRPEGMWVVLHAPIETALAHALSSLHEVPITAAWFLDASGLSRQDPWSYLRFHAAHHRPLGGALRSPFSRPRSSLLPDIGTMGVAPCVNPPGAYFEALYGGRDGYGMLYTLTARDELALMDLWRA